MYYATPPNSSKATTALVLAILAWVVCPVVLAIAALVVASGADDEIKASNGQLQGQNLVTAARVLSIVNLIIPGLIVLLILIIAVFGSAASVGH